MTQRQKMLAGQLYSPADEALSAEASRAARLSRRYNNTSPDDCAERLAILRELLGGLGEDSMLCPGLHFDYGCNTYIGARCWINVNLTVCDCAEVRIGNDVLIGPGVSFLTPVHPLVMDERVFRRDAQGALYNLEYAKPITVEDGVWLAGNVTISGGVTIGRGAVVGAGSVVTRDVPPFTLAVGNPCRVLRPITEADRLLPR